MTIWMCFALWFNLTVAILSAGAAAISKMKGERGEVILFLLLLALNSAGVVWHITMLIQALIPK